MLDALKTLTINNRDSLQRQPLADKLIRLLNQQNIQLSPMLLDGRWGSGRSQFALKLLHMLGPDSPQQLIHIDALQLEHCGSAWLMLINAIHKVVDSKNKARLTELTLSFKRADDLPHYIAQYQQSLALQQLLVDIVRQRHLLIVIDELDRCQPEFVIQCLKASYSLSEINGIQVILVAGMTPLESAVRQSYGAEIDARRFLNKFIRYTCFLPDQLSAEDNAERMPVALQHYLDLIKRNSELKKAGFSKAPLLTILSQVIQAQHLSLQEVEHLIRHIEIFQTLTDGQGFATNALLIQKLFNLFGIMLVAFKPELARAIMDGRSDAAQLAAFLGVKQPLFLENENAYQSIDHHILLIMLGPECRLNADIFQLPGEQRAYWQKLVFKYFHHAPGQGGRLRLLINSLEQFSN